MNGKEFKEKIVENIEKVIVGKKNTIELLLTAIIADGHVLLEDVPGTGKTKLAKSLAKTIQADFNRIQFTPDLLPGDITGINVYNNRENEFKLRKGPVFTNILLADEINRATPRTQAGLLECMEERQITIDGETYEAGKPFFVIATQNPVDTAGTFPLPEAQMDRFMMRLHMDLPQKEEELAIMEKYMTEEPLVNLKSVISLEELKQAKEEANQVFVHHCIREYMVEIIDKTRKNSEIVMGVSPRGTLAFLRCVKAYAFLQGRNYCTPDDVIKLAAPVLAHRIILGYGRTQSGEQTITSIVESLSVPTEDFSI